MLGGDTLRTNEIGNLAILFTDQTQIRVGRNSTLTVNDVAGGTAGTTQLSLQAGNIWARAARGGSGVDVKTPAAVAAIRGTDWSLSVDGSRTSLIVLEGVVELSNAQGSVTVRQGEGAVASIGQAPTKFVLTNSNDREQMLFYMSLRDTFSSISTSPLTGPASRGERDRIVAIPPQARSAEDWLDLAEMAPSLDGRAVAARRPRPGPQPAPERRRSAPAPIWSRPLSSARSIAGPKRPRCSPGPNGASIRSGASARPTGATSPNPWPIRSGPMPSRNSRRTSPLRCSPMPMWWPSARI